MSRRPCGSVTRERPVGTAATIRAGPVVLETEAMATPLQRDETTSAPTETVSIGELVEFVKTYAKQETIGPLKGAGRWIAFGAAGAVCLGLGLSLLLLGLLRLLQSEWGWAQTQGRSWLPYLIVLVACVALLAITLTRIPKKFLNKDAD